MHEQVNKIILEDEICIRCILSPLFCHSTKMKLKENAFLPPPGSNEVSLLRLMYTDLNRCKLHAKHIEETLKEKVSGIQYQGLASITSKDVNEANKISSMSCQIVYAPMDKEGNYIPNNKDIYADESGLPMHANLLYPYKMVKGEVMTKARKYARQLLKLAKFEYDNNPESMTWNGNDIVDKKGHS